MRLRASSLVVAALLLAGCNAGHGSGVVPGLPSLSAAHTLAAPAAAPQRLAKSSGKIKHVVIIVQENRSFNNLFLGYPSAKTEKYGEDTNGDKIKLLPIGLETTWDLDHSSTSFFEACNGTGSIPGTHCRMNGF